MVEKVRNIIGNTIESFGIKNVSPFVSKVLQDLTNILPKQSATIHGRKDNGRVMLHELLPYSFQLAETQEIMTNFPMSHVSMLQQTSDTSSTLAHGTMNTPISTITSCDHLPNQNPVYWPKCPDNAYIGYISFKIWCIMCMWSFYNKRFHPEK